MLSRGLQIFLSVLIYFCSTLAGMAKTTTPEEVRAEFFVTAEIDQSELTENFVANELDETSDQHSHHTLDDFALPASISNAAQAENGGENGKNQKRNHKRTNSIKLNHSKCRILTSLPEKSETRGIAKHPENQDARQERTAAIRFLHLKALAC